NVERAARAGVDVVCGSTGWYDRLPEVAKVVDAAGTALIAASNFSIGVHVFNSISRRLAAIMNRLPQYAPSMSETHHVHKLDHPSGTALTIAEGIISETDRLEGWADTGVIREDAPEAERKAQEAEAERLFSQAPADQLPITTYRRGEVPGIHEVKWVSPVDEITISHSAKSRDGFALGAVMAAEWIAGRKGVYSIAQMMDSLLG
ncbi:MAG: 4-hydroxy-tetrahydrodipicolinate reductase, partial [Duncaniella sp.]|nr:4-hydroxy-tetrahydrodipicolinate reductase [Duncaniella sp.]